VNHSSPWHRAIADENRILLTEVGSGLHGVTIAETDDHDEMGVCIPPPSCVIGLGKFEQYADRWHLDGTPTDTDEDLARGISNRSGPGDTDHTTYSLNKWARLAAEGNPTVLMILFAPDNKVQETDDYCFGTDLRANRHLFITKQAGKRFEGYLKAQKDRMLGLRGRKHTNRPELVEKFGFDTKCAYHALRLAFQGQELMMTGKITLPMVPDNVAFLRDVRQGVFTLNEVINYIDMNIGVLQAVTRSSVLPEGPDYGLLNEYLVDTHRDWWETKGIL
jgi:predicted nucleotidyltransferase